MTTNIFAYFSPYDNAPHLSQVYANIIYMLYSVTVKPGSKKGPLVIANGDNLVVYLREKPIDGAANTALLKLLSAYFKVPKTCIEIKTGHTSRNKRIEIPVEILPHSENL